MKKEEIAKELFSHTDIVFVLLGAVFVLLGLSGGVSSQIFSLPINDPAARLAALFIGVVFIALGIYLAWLRPIRFRQESSVEVKVLRTAEELYMYVKKRIEQAQERVDDLTWGPATGEITTEADNQALEEYIEAIEAVCRKGRVCYREVMAFPPIEGIEVRVRRAERMLRQNLFSYHLRYYEYPAEGIPPLLSFMVVDSEEVIFALYCYPYMPLTGEIRLAVRNKEIVRLFQGYYETIWQGAKVLKEGDNVRWDALEGIKKRLGLNL